MFVPTGRCSRSIGLMPYLIRTNGKKLELLPVACSAPTQAHHRGASLVRASGTGLNVDGARSSRVAIAPTLTHANVICLTRACIRLACYVGSQAACSFLTRSTCRSDGRPRRGPFLQAPSKRHVESH